MGEISISQGELVAFGASTPVVSRWCIDGAGRVTRLLAAGRVAVHGYGADGHSFLTARRPTDAVAAYMTGFAVWDGRTDTAEMTLPPKLQDAIWTVRDTVSAKDPVRITLHSFDVRTGQEVLDGLKLPLRAWSDWPSRYGDRFYLAVPGGQVLIGDAATHRWGKTRLVGSADDDVLDVASTSDGSRVAVAFQSYRNASAPQLSDGGSSTYVQMYDGRTGTSVGPPRPNGNSVALSDAGVLAVASRGSVALVDSTTMRTIRELPGARAAVNNLAFSDDGTLLVATADDQTLSLHDAASGIRLGEPLSASVPFSNLDLLIAGAPAFTVGAIADPGFLRQDGKVVLVTVAQGVGEWDLDPAHLGSAACTLAGRNLTRSEWATYDSAFGDYRRTCPDQH